MNNIAELLNIGINNPGGGGGISTAGFVIAIVRNGLILLFAIVVIFAIIYSAQAGLKFVTSEGASDKVEEAREAIKNVLIGVAAAFVGVIGVFIISNIFSPNTSAEFSLRCFFGDFYTCGVREVSSVDSCLQEGEAAIQYTNTPGAGAGVGPTLISLTDASQTSTTICPDRRIYCAKTERIAGEITAFPANTGARCEAGYLIDNIKDDTRTLTPSI